MDHNFGTDSVSSSLGPTDNNKNVDERPVISVIIDQDEDEEDEEDQHQQRQEEAHIVLQDHDYVSGVSAGHKTPTPPAEPPQPQGKKEFPILHGLNIDHLEDEMGTGSTFPGTYPPFRHQRRVVRKQPPLVGRSGGGGTLMSLAAPVRAIGSYSPSANAGNNSSLRVATATAGQSPTMVKRTYSSNTSSTPIMKQQRQHFEQQQQRRMISREQHQQLLQQHHQIQQHNNNSSGNAFADVMAEEELENEKFFSRSQPSSQHRQQQQQHSATATTTTALRRGRPPKKQQTEDIFDDANNVMMSYHQQQQLQQQQQQQQAESSKPPDDPVPVSHQQHHRHQQPHYRQQLRQYESSSIDSSIDSVVRGDAMVMQSFVAPPPASLSCSTAGFGGVVGTASSPATATPSSSSSFTVPTMTTTPLKHHQQQQHFVEHHQQQHHNSQQLHYNNHHHHLQQQHPSVPTPVTSSAADSSGGGRGSATVVHHQHRNHYPMTVDHHQQQAVVAQQHSAVASQGLEDLADLAQASSSLLQQATSSMLRAPAPPPSSSSSSATAVVASAAAYQQPPPPPSFLQQQHHQPTLHFKVVATNNRPESYHPQEYHRQQVFTVQQQLQQQRDAAADDDDDEGSTTRDGVHQQHRHRATKTTPVAKKLTKKQMQTIQREFAEMLPYGRNPKEKATAPTDGGTKQKRTARTSKTETEEAPMKGDGELRGGTAVRPLRSSATGVKRSADESTTGQTVAETTEPTQKKRRTWDGADDYVTRCICGMVHNDPFMIQCDQCDVWQHAICMGIVSKRAVPEQYFCEQCHPRELLLSASQAAAKQKAFLISLPPPPLGLRRGRKKNKLKLQQQQQQLLQRRRKRMLGHRPNALKSLASSSATSQLATVLRGGALAPKRRGRPPRKQQLDGKEAVVVPPGAVNAVTVSSTKELQQLSGTTTITTTSAGGVDTSTLLSSSHRDSAAAAMLLLHDNNVVLNNDNNCDDDSATAEDAIDDEKQQPTIAKAAAPLAVQPTHIENCYSRAVKALMAQLVPDSRTHLAALQRLKSSPPLTRQMYVAPNVEGLVATPGDLPKVLAGTLLIEYNGMISLLSEVQTRTPNKLNQHNFTLIYNGLGEGKELFVDATRMLSDARSVRKSCRPNAAVRHAISDGHIHIYLVATTDIDKSNEVTIPFDSDYWDSCVPVPCACGFSKGQLSASSSLAAAVPRCPVQEFNEALTSGDSAIFQAKKMKRMATRSFSNAITSAAVPGNSSSTTAGNDNTDDINRRNSMGSKHATDKKTVVKKEVEEPDVGGISGTKTTSPVKKTMSPVKKTTTDQHKRDNEEVDDHNNASFRQLWDELGRILRSKLLTVDDFKLPTEFAQKCM